MVFLHKALLDVAAFVCISFLIFPVGIGNVPSVAKERVTQSSEDMKPKGDVLEMLNSQPGELYTGNTTGLDIYNATNPYTAMSTTPFDEVDQTEGPNAVNILIAGDEEAENFEYWIPYYQVSGVFVNWDLYTEWQIERGDEALVAQYGIDFRVRGVVSFNSDDDRHTSLGLIRNVMDQTGWHDDFVYNGYQIDVLLAVTNQEPLMDSTGSREIIGEAFSEWRDRPVHNNTIIVKWFSYWADDNVVQHEMSHIFNGLVDHYEGEPGYNDDCIMSSRPQYISYIYENGYVWIIFANEHTSLLTSNYHTQCNNYMLSWVYHDINLDGKVDVRDMAMMAQYFGIVIW